jgi:hypothetical protein
MKGSPTNDLIPLEIAVRCLFSAIYDDAPTHERLTGLAQALVALVPVYMRAPEGGVSAVTESQLRDGLVRDAGTAIQFRDGRPAIEDLFVSSMSLENATSMLAEPQVPTPTMASRAWQTSS